MCFVNSSGDTDKEICQALEFIARISHNSTESTTGNSYKAMINYLLDRRHYGVFEHVSVTFLVVTNRAIANEFRTHRMMSFVQESTRWVKMKGTIKCIWNEKLDRTSETKADSLNAISTSIRTYQKLLEKKVLAEDARDVLPHNLATRFAVTANLSSWMHFLTVRMAPDAHPQMRALAEMIYGHLLTLVPTIFSHPNSLDKD